VKDIAVGEWFTWLLDNAIWLQSLPWLLLVLLLAPLALLGFWKQIYPHTPLVVLMLAPCLLSLGALFRPEIFLVVATLDVALVLVAVADLLSLPPARSLDAERSTLRIVSVQQRHPVTLTILNRSSRGWHVAIRDDVPQEFTASPDELVRRLPPRSRVVLHYELRASRRGSFSMDRVYVRVRSLLGLWQRYLTYPAASVLHVYPDMKQLSEYAILARTNRLSLMGLRRMRRVGQDHDFERLRDYTPDDNYKHIDWRTTARRNKLTVKDFQTSQSQRIIFLLDCGRMMTNQAAGLSLLDHSLNAMLMLSYVALRKGDSVGLICFSDEIHNYVPPRSGMSQMNKLLHASFNRFPQLVESRYDQAFFYLSSHCKKRSLVVLMTNLIDEVNANQVERYLSTLVGRHLPLGVLMRDHQLFDAAADAQPHDSALYRAAAAAHILNWRQQVLTDLQHQGVLSLDVFPEDMTAPLVNQYLEIKARHLL
jgi:uncharacterized protein (DUF58 family)